MSLKFSCPHCEVSLSAEPEHYSKQVDCPECSKPLIVPSPQDLGAAPQEDPNVVKFLCPYCSRRLSATPTHYGKEMPCPHPDCHQVVLVPRPEWKPIPTTLIKQGQVGANELVRKAQELTRKHKGI